MTALTADLRGVTATWSWVDADAAAAGRLPSGVVIDHGDHYLAVPWVTWPGGPERVFTLDSLLPLTVVESVRCGVCGVEGRIEQGAWLPSANGGVL